jgi:TRAP transporter TAXI family solute receptor
MSKHAASVVCLCLLFAAVSESAEDPMLKLCTGSPSGNYFASGQEIQRQLSRQGVAIELVETGGSMDNLQKMATEECDAGFAQIDAYLHYQAINQANRLEVEWPRHLYGEYVHLVCHRDAAIASIKDLRQAKPSQTLLVGASGSGSAITWSSLARLEPDYLDVRTEMAAPHDALAAVRDGEANCLVFVSGLNSEFLGSVEEAGELLKLVPVDDRVLEDAKHLGKPIYEFQEIPAGTYSNLQAPAGMPVTTLVVRAVLLISSTWATQNRFAYDTLVDGIKRATPIIKKRVAEN